MSKPLDPLQDPVTNIVAEIKAATEAVKVAKRGGRLSIIYAVIFAEIGLLFCARC